MKRSEESEPVLISVYFLFLLCLSKVKYYWSRLKFQLKEEQKTTVKSSGMVMYQDVLAVFPNEEATILDKINEKLRPPLPPFQ